MGIIFFFLFFLYNLITIYLQNILKSILKIPSIRVCVLIITYLKYNDRKKKYESNHHLPEKQSSKMENKILKNPLLIVNGYYSY